MTRCTPECNVFICAARRECKRKRIAQMWKYQATMEEVEDEDAWVHIRGGVTEGELLAENELVEEVIKEHFIQKKESYWRRMN
jgi:hypothetical protein